MSLVCIRTLTTFKGFVTVTCIIHGIPVDTIPLNNDGELKPNAHKKWMARRKIKETELHAGLSAITIDLPGRHDVLRGRGGLIVGTKSHCTFNLLTILFPAQARTFMGILETY